MEYVEVDQRQIQKLGGQYAFHPTAKLIMNLIKPLSPTVPIIAHEYVIVTRKQPEK